ncbi:pectate lyase [Bacteroidota bacterium]
MRLTMVLLFVLLGLASSCDNVPKNESNDLPSKAKKTMDLATEYMRSISVEGGFLWRYSTDFTMFFGEAEATPTQAWVQSPGTPAMGFAFLRAYEVTKDPVYLTAAVEAAMALVKGQLQSGGWDYRIEYDPEKRKDYYYRIEDSKLPKTVNADQKNRSTYDDDNTQEALRYLMAYLNTSEKYPHTYDKQIRNALDYGLAKLLESQYPNGAWPQRWDGLPHDPSKYPVKAASLYDDYPPEQPSGSYYGYYTFNDNSHRDLVNTLVLAWKFTGKEEYLGAAIHGLDYLLLSQLPEPQPVWAQQYDADMHPAWARSFEPPSITTGESVGIIEMLVDYYLEFGDEKYLEPLPGAIAWFNRSKLESGEWARMYELNTNRPIYGDRDKKIHYTLEEISEERRNGYRWQGEFGVADMIAYYDTVIRSGREKWLEEHPGFTDHENRLINKDIPADLDLESEVKKIIESMDGQNRWIQNSPAEGKAWITTSDYIRNMNILSNYLQVNKSR